MEIYNHLNQNVQIDDEIRDYFSGDVYRSEKIKSGKNTILPLTINLDGAKIFSSSTSTLWPIQLVQNYLPPKIRFLTKNILLVGLYCGKKKPHISTIMLPLASELNFIQKKGIAIWHIDKLLNFSPAIMYCSCDIPARAEVQNMKPSGYFSCPCCEQKGMLVNNPKTKKSYVRLLKMQETAPKRTHNKSKNASIKFASSTGDSDVQGLKGLSCVIGLKHFNLVDSYEVDYMHGTCIGIVKLMLDFWLGKKPVVYAEDETCRFKMFNSQQRIEFNCRIIALKPPTRINHKPRSILERSFFTANEYRSLLWFYLRFAVKGLLDKKLIEHFNLLSSSTYILSKSTITQAEVQQARNKLNQFADEFEIFYGRNSVTLNVHLARHYSDVVINTGPLWCHSLFAFESNIGNLKRSFCSKCDIVEQIAFNYCIKSTENFLCEHPHNEKRTMQILRGKPKCISIEFEHVLTASGLSSPNHIYHIGYEMSFKSEVLKSVSSALTKSVDFFTQLNNGIIGAIELFIKAETDYLLLQKYDIIEEFDHLKQVQPSGEYQISKCDEIKQKMIYLKFNYSRVSFIEIVTLEPNFFETN